MISVVAIDAASAEVTFGIVLLWGKSHTAYNTFLPCFRDVDPKTVIAFRCMADVPAIDRMWIECCYCWWSLVHH